MDSIFRKVAGFSCVSNAGKVYIGNSVTNALCELDENSGEVTILGHDEKCDSFLGATWGKNARIGNRILFVPLLGKEFAVLDLDSKSITKLSIDLANCSDIKDDSLKFWYIHTYDVFFYVIGQQCPYIIRIDANTLEEQIVSIEFDNCDDDNLTYFFTDGCVQRDSVLYIPTGKDSTLLKFSLVDSEYEFVRVPISIKKIASISCLKDTIWITGFDEKQGKIALWNASLGNVLELEISEHGIWHAPVFLNTFAYLFPADNDSKVIRINIDSHEIAVIDEIDCLFCKDEILNEIRTSSALLVGKDADKITFIRRPGNTWFTYDVTTKVLSRKVYCISDSVYLNKVEKDFYDHEFEVKKEDCSIFDESNFPLRFFLERI